MWLMPQVKALAEFGDLVVVLMVMMMIIIIMISCNVDVAVSQPGASLASPAW